MYGTQDKNIKRKKKAIKTIWHGLVAQLEIKDRACACHLIVAPITLMTNIVN